MAQVTLEEVASRVATIEASSGDFEAAHAMEDDLHIDVLRAIAHGNSDPVGLASEALRSLAIPFNRACA